MKTKKVNPRNKRPFYGQRSDKRGINVEGSWKAVELDPSLFAEEGMEGLVCFEELTDYRILDSKAIAADGKDEPKKNKKAKKRKSAEGEEAVVKVDIESKEADVTVEPAKKKAKRKNKSKGKKMNSDESDQPDGTSAKETQEGVATGEVAGDNQGTHEEIVKCVESDLDAFTKPTKKRKKRNNRKKQSQNDAGTVELSNSESHSELQTVKNEKSIKDKTLKPVKKQQQKKNWTEAVLDSRNDRTTDVSAWKDLFVPTPVLNALSRLGFGSPTPIQALTLPSAIRDHMDILGAAETGKVNYFCRTLAFCCYILLN